MDFAEIYETYFKDVYLYVYRLSGEEHTAEDVTSEAFFRAMRAIDDFRGDCDIRVWLCQIAKNCYYTRQKREKRQLATDLSTAPITDDAPTALEELIRREEAARVRLLLHEIGEPYKEVFMWRVFAELSFRQIGELFHKSENWACVTYHRARQRIREKWREKYGE